MAKLKLKYRITESGKFCLSWEDCRKFGPDLFDMGDISQGKTVEALVTIFDLAGFTQQCPVRFLQRHNPSAAEVRGDDYSASEIHFGC